MIGMVQSSSNSALHSYGSDIMWVLNIEVDYGPKYIVMNWQATITIIAMIPKLYCQV